jgi:hypothetical protein
MTDEPHGLEDYTAALLEKGVGAIQAKILLTPLSRGGKEPLTLKTCKLP